MPAPRRLVSLLRPLVMLALALGSAAITFGSLGYFDTEEYSAFMLEKLPLPHEELWLFALQVHVAAAAFALPACLALTAAALLRRAPRLHRWLGRMTGVVVLLALVPSGSYLAFFAKGGLPSTAGFLASGALVVVAMVQGIRTARAGQFVEHRRWVMHVLAQLSVAVTSRALLFAFDAFALEETLSYLVALWLPVVGSAALVEALSPRPHPLPRRNHEAPHAAVHPHAVQSGLRGAARA